MTRLQYLKNYIKMIEEDWGEKLTDQEIAILIIHLRTGYERMMEMRRARLIDEPAFDPADLDFNR